MKLYKLQLFLKGFNYTLPMEGRYIVSAVNKDVIQDFLFNFHPHSELWFKTFLLCRNDGRFESIRIAIFCDFVDYEIDEGEIKKWLENLNTKLDPQEIKFDCMEISEDK